MCKFYIKFTRHFLQSVIFEILKTYSHLTTVPIIKYSPCQKNIISYFLPFKIFKLKTCISKVFTYSCIKNLFNIEWNHYRIYNDNVFVVKKNGSNNNFSLFCWYIELNRDEQNNKTPRLISLT